MFWRRRRWRAPSVIQTSALDCGPAALACVLEGYGLPAGYERLRELCHTDVDGTSIDALETVAQRLGLEATQVVVPEDHVFLGASLPAIVIIRQANGLTHFCVAWRRLGPWLQIMDPARGRRWVRTQSWLQNLYQHRIKVPRSAYLEWTQSNDFIAAQIERCRHLGVSDGTARALVARSVEARNVAPIQHLDGAIRLASALRRGGAWRRWSSAKRLLELLNCAQGESGSPIPNQFLRVKQAPGNGDDLIVSGAVAVRFSQAAQAEAKVERRSSRQSRWVRDFLGLFGSNHRKSLGYLAAAAVVAGSLLVLEILVFRFLITPVVRLQPADVQGLLAGAVGALAALALVLENRLTAAAQRLGRQLDTRLRQRLLERIPKTKPQYFMSRLSADLAARAHSIYRLRAVPGIGRQILQTGAQIGLTSLALVWLIPEAAALIGGLMLAAFVIPLGLHRLQSEHDLAARTHSGALSRFYLASLRGLTAVRAHGAEQALRREHEALLTRWGRVSQRLLRLNLLGFTLQAGLCTVLAVGIVLMALRSSGGTSAALLTTYWALRIPPLAQAFADLLRQLPALKSTALRASEPLTAPLWPEGKGACAGRDSSPLSSAVTIEDLRVIAGGRTLLTVDRLNIARGERVAIVGRSGAGKSTLLRTLLGLVAQTSKSFEVFGVTYSEKNIFELRRRMNWLDPDVWLYDASLLDNLVFGRRGEDFSIEQQIDFAGLAPMLARRTEGVALNLGEGGSRLSGGEGQRVRLGRAVGQDAELLLWDEAFRGLERPVRRELLEQSLTRWPQAAMLYVTHDLAEAHDYFDRVLVIQAGRIVEDGRPQELVNNRQGAFAQLMRFEGRRTLAFEDPNWHRWQLRGGELEIETAHGNDRQPRLV